MVELKGPKLQEIKQLIKEKNKITFYTLNDKTFCGQINWFDNGTFNITLDDGTNITLYESALAYYSKG